MLGLMLAGGGRVQAVYRSLRSVVATAYGVDIPQVVGRDLDTEPVYEITADNPWPEGPTDSGKVRADRHRQALSEFPGMLRNLLETHFGLVVKRERRQMQGYVLNIGPSGSKLTPDSDAPDWKEGTGMADGEVVATRAPVSVIIRLLEDMLRAPVVDQTGLKGTYDYKLTWKPAPSGGTPEAATMAKALEEQLGLHLEAKSVALDVVNVVSMKAPEEVITAESITVNFENADIGQVISAVQIATHKTFVVDPRVHANVTYASPSPMSSAEFYQAFLNILREKHLVAASREDFIQITPEAIGH